jgi:hypothetical protein
MAAKKITLKCGVEMEHWSNRDSELLKVSIHGFYEGYGKMNSLKLVSDMLLELHELGYKNQGMSRHEGRYGTTDDLFLIVNREISKQKK